MDRREIQTCTNETEDNRMNNLDGSYSTNQLHLRAKRQDVANRVRDSKFGRATGTADQSERGLQAKQ